VLLSLSIALDCLFHVAPLHLTPHSISSLHLTLTATTAEAAAAAKSTQNTVTKQALQTAFNWTRFVMQRSPRSRFENDLADLFSFAVTGAGHSDIDVAKQSHETALAVCGSIYGDDDFFVGASAVSNQYADIIYVLMRNKCFKDWSGSVLEVK
jgi:hypothetical protein